MLKRTFAAFMLLTALLVTSTIAQAGDVYVRGYYRSSGTYVPSHYRSSADGYFYNNYSAYPNINPYTGSTGTRHTPSYGSYSSPYRSLWGW